MNLTAFAAILALLGAEQSAPAAGFAVTGASLRPTGYACLLTASVDYRFSPAVIEALQHGVPLTLAIHFSLANRSGHHAADNPLAHLTRRLQVSYHPLTRAYRVAYPDTGVLEHVATLTTLIEYLGSIRDWPVLSSCALPPGQVWQASLRVSLDIEALPLPLRPIAYLSPDWHLESPPYPWRVAG